LILFRERVLKATSDPGWLVALKIQPNVVTVAFLTRSHNLFINY